MKMTKRRWGGAILAVVSLLLQASIFLGNTDFPTENPRSRVDSQLIAMLRSKPGLHLALAQDYKIVDPLDLQD